jgi:hypothetical protein
MAEQAIVGLNDLAIGDTQLVVQRAMQAPTVRPLPPPPPPPPLCSGHYILRVGFLSEDDGLISSNVSLIYIYIFILLMLFFGCVIHTNIVADGRAHQLAARHQSARAYEHGHGGRACSRRRLPR